MGILETFRFGHIETLGTLGIFMSTLGILETFRFDIHEHIGYIGDIEI